MSLRPRLLTAVLFAALLSNFSPLQAAPQAQAGAPVAEPSKSLYWQGHEALGKGDWTTALENFRALEGQLANSKTEPRDAAIYWQAYALTHARRPREATVQIERLRKLYPGSAWLDDADALAPRRERTEREKRERDPGDEREADALRALDALLSGSTQKVVPLLQRVLSGNHTDRVKSRAIFVLSQIDPVAADVALDAVITGSASSRLKSEAIRMIAAGGRRSSLDRLLPLYRSSTDMAVKRGVLDAFLIGDRGDLMLQVIEGESHVRRRREAIEKLGAMGKGAELKKLYATRSDPQDRLAVLRAFGIAGDRAALIEVARTETEVAVRAEAIRSIGIAGGKEAGTVLLGFYQPDQPEAVIDAVIEAMMIAGASEQMVEIYRKETDPRRKRELLQKIAASDSDAALELIDKALQP